jgi:hypothetical protein
MTNMSTHHTANTTITPPTGPTPGSTSETNTESATQRIDRELAELHASGIDRSVWERIRAEHPEDAQDLAYRLGGLTARQEVSR